MKHERTKRAKRIEWVSSVVDVAIILCLQPFREIKRSSLPLGSHRFASLTHLFPVIKYIHNLHRNVLPAHNVAGRRGSLCAAQLERLLKDERKE